jgi:hypothetical protein
MIMKIDNPFQLTEHSMFHPSNIEKQSNFDTNMPYQGFLAKDLGGQAQAGNHNGYSGPSMFNN